MSSEEQDQWKARWLPKGLPETLLDEMIVEANAEYESELEYSPYNRYNSLGVIIDDNNSEEDCFYLITVQRGDWVFQGKALLESEYLFAEIPTIEVVIQVFKLKWTSILEVFAFGYSIFAHTKDESVTIEVNTIETEPEPDISICNGDFEAWEIISGIVPDILRSGAHTGNYWMAQHFEGGEYRAFTAYRAINNLSSNEVECLTAWFYRLYELTAIWFMRIHYSDDTYDERMVDAGAGWRDFSLNVTPNKTIIGVSIGTASTDEYLAGFDDVIFELP